MWLSETSTSRVFPGGERSKRTHLSFGILDTDPHSGIDPELVIEHVKKQNLFL